MTEDLRIVAVLPALNEAGTISRIVFQTISFLPVIVVDDGSIDGTADLAEAAGALVVRHEINHGYDSALSSGLDLALQNDYTHAITMDADGQHDPSIVQDFIEALRDGTELVLGRRDRFQRISEKVFSLVAKKKWGIVDPLCGMKAYKLSLLKKFGPFSTFKSVGTEFAIRLVDKVGIKFEQIPIKSQVRKDRSRFGGSFRGNFKIIYSLVWVLRRTK